MDKFKEFIEQLTTNETISCLMEPIIDDQTPVSGNPDELRPIEVATVAYVKAVFGEDHVIYQRVIEGIAERRPTPALLADWLIDLELPELIQVQDFINGIYNARRAGEQGDAA